MLHVARKTYTGFYSYFFPSCYSSRVMMEEEQISAVSSTSDERWIDSDDDLSDGL